MNERDAEIIKALETLYGKDFQELDKDVAKQTIFEMLDNLDLLSNEAPLPYEKLSDEAQMDLLIKLLKLLRGDISPAESATTQPAE